MEGKAAFISLHSHCLPTPASLNSVSSFLCPAPLPVAHSHILCLMALLRGLLRFVFRQGTCRQCRLCAGTAAVARPVLCEDLLVLRDLTLTSCILSVKLGNSYCWLTLGMERRNAPALKANVRKLV